MGQTAAFEGPFRSLHSCLIPTRPRSSWFAPCGGTAFIGTTETGGLVPRPLRITVETTSMEGEMEPIVYERGLARLIHHEVDHLAGLLYTARMRADTASIPVEQYRQTGRAWACEE
ncbi:peptide deformylase [Streptomyces sp. NPDC092359]|uniref:peptide deformylase n=1 Tax=Streptomyces sp. NPDC092359 TaxID=3366014 RepID=UPI00380AF230